MGQFSWLDCKTQEQIVDGRCRNSYVPVPQEFGGGHIVERCYDGYGHFGGHDVYDLVADWNRAHIDKTMIRKPERENWGDGKFADEFFAKAMERYNRDCNMVDDFTAGFDDDAMRERYGDDYKRIIGIRIACLDEENARLRYPIKITHDPEAVYEWCAPSKSDPNQGWVIR